MTDRTREAVIKAAAETAITAIRDAGLLSDADPNLVFGITFRALYDAGLLHAPAEWRPISEARLNERVIGRRGGHVSVTTGHSDGWWSGFGSGMNAPIYFLPLSILPPPPGGRDHG